MNTIKVLKHGIKVNGKYIKCGYSMGPYINLPENVITVYGWDLPAELSPQNDSDSMTDYFEKDRARIFPSHPLYSQFLKQIEAKNQNVEHALLKSRLRQFAGMGVSE